MEVLILIVEALHYCEQVMDLKADLPFLFYNKRIWQKMFRLERQTLDDVPRSDHHVKAVTPETIQFEEVEILPE
ncbi:hypothetical protein J6590_071891 [Homalodisca vitripennis]|nr:hypothetical protein J6590_071891 [Homalodisca vitripennis]